MLHYWLIFITLSVYVSLCQNTLSFVTHVSFLANEDHESNITAL